MDHTISNTIEIRINGKRFETSLGWFPSAASAWHGSPGCVGGRSWRVTVAVGCPALAVLTPLLVREFRGSNTLEILKGVLFFFFTSSFEQWYIAFSHVEEARRLVSSIAFLTNAISAVIRSEAAPAKLKGTSSRFSACHVVAAFVFLDALSALRTLFDGTPAFQGLQQRHFFVLFCILIILRARAVFVPLTSVRETRLTPAHVARHNGRPVHAWMLLPVATAPPGTPSKLLIILQAISQEKLIIRFKD